MTIPPPESVWRDGVLYWRIDEGWVARRPGTPRYLRPEDPPVPVSARWDLYRRADDGEFVYVGPATDVKQTWPEERPPVRLPRSAEQRHDGHDQGEDGPA